MKLFFHFSFAYKMLGRSRAGVGSRVKTLVREVLAGPPLLREGAFGGPQARERMLYSFGADADPAAWEAVSDADFGGRSRAKLEPTEQGTWVFSGALDLSTEGTEMKQAGYAGLQPRQRKTVKSLEGFDALEVRAKTDGRVYIANIKTDSMVKHHLFQAFFTTRNDEWTNVVLPFDRFTLTFQGQVEGESLPIDPRQFQAVSFLMAERKDGEFRMELEWVKAINTRLRKGARYTGLIQDLD